MNTPEFSELVNVLERNEVALFDRILSKVNKSQMVDESGFSLLHFAAQEGRLEIMQLLLNRGLNPDLQDKNGFAPIHLAAGEGQADAVRKLIENGCSVNVPCPVNDNSTALHVAAVWDRNEVVRELLSAGADITLKDSKGNTPLDLAKANRNASIVALLRTAGGK